MDTQMTFADLDHMIEYWGTDLCDNDCIFLNQAANMNAAFWHQEHKNIQFSMMEERLGYLNYLHMKTEMEIAHASGLAKFMENTITKLENWFVAFKETEFIDITRYMYGLFGTTDITLNCLKNEVELIMREIKQIKKHNAKNPIENIGKIMEALLKSLHFTDSKMVNMQNRIQWIDQEIKNIVDQSQTNACCCFFPFSRQISITVEE